MHTLKDFTYHYVTDLFSSGQIYITLELFENIFAKSSILDIWIGSEQISNTYDYFYELPPQHYSHLLWLKN